MHKWSEWNFATFISVFCRSIFQSIFKLIVWNSKKILLNSDHFPTNNPYRYLEFGIHFIKVYYFRNWKLKFPLIYLANLMVRNDKFLSWVHERSGNDLTKHPDPPLDVGGSSSRSSSHCSRQIYFDIFEQSSVRNMGNLTSLFCFCC